ncbi:alkaline phosphatase [Cytobacillus sp. FJAT-54145]|uniref:Alkaline phosphatase n=1 Tax=Cytobacillus spartinae TaxID=3299023 RepID=A0ABW6KBM9_9BACI
MKKNLKNKLVGMTVAGAIVASSFSYASSINFVSADDKTKKPTNVIMMVMDGTSSGATTLARWYKGEALAMEEIASGAVRTYSAESAITDSAPAATALATGHKSNDKYIGVLPSVVNSPGLDQVAEEEAFKPVANVLEGAKKQGKATGIISTSEIQHATPAGFSAHVTSRSNYGDIAEQQVYQGIDVVLGGGKEALQPGEERNSRKDGEDLVRYLEGNGYDLVEDRNELLSSKSNKIWGAFAPNALKYDLDRQTSKSNEPSLADMTKKAIDTLSKDKDGFFLFVEGSKIDWSAHGNDTIGMITDVIAFDDAVNEALKFAKKDGNTMVIAVSDHGNSGITIGNMNTSNTYTNIPVSTYVDPLKKATMTLEGALTQLKEDKSNMKEVAALYGLDDLSDEEMKSLKEAKDARALQSLMSKMLANRANIGFTTGGHTGEDVFLYSYGPSRPFGTVENTDLAKTMAKFMGFDLSKLTDELYVNAEGMYAKKGYTTEILKDGNYENNEVFVATKGNVRIEFPINKNYATVYRTVSSKTFKSTKKLDGITVYNEKDFYIHSKASSLVK